MVSELSSVDKVVGAKQVRRALNDGRACKVFLACDADPRVVEPLARLAQEGQVQVQNILCDRPSSVNCQKCGSDSCG